MDDLQLELSRDTRKLKKEHLESRRVEVDLVLVEAAISAQKTKEEEQAVHNKYRTDDVIDVILFCQDLLDAGVFVLALSTIIRFMAWYNCLEEEADEGYQVNIIWLKVRTAARAKRRRCW